MTTATYQEQINALADRVAALEAGTPGRSDPLPREPQPGDERLWEALQSWRYDRAQVEGFDAYRIFGNQIMTAIATEKPADKFELLQIKGLGRHKIDLYGDDIIAIVREHSEW